MNIKPVLPGHVLVIPFRAANRLTDLTGEEVTDLFTTVQKVQRMLAGVYFDEDGKERHGSMEENVLKGGFNIA